MIILTRMMAKMTLLGIEAYHPLQLMGALSF
jgi:hypothetical protein